MPKRMLIDATHPEETRVVVTDGTELLEYEYETSTKRQLKGNIYLAKVTRVEPSLQAAFVDFGGNRHGFLAFNEIHPDYYRIPVEDREKILAESDRAEDDDEGGEEPAAEGESFEVVGEDADEDIHELGDAHRKRVRELTRMYKIQEVIKRRQILLVQVVKEERGNKGAALTTYLSLPGRYCVLMPNTSRGGGISRKVTDPKSRKQMRKLLSELEVPDGMAVIMRTAGVERTKSEIKRDYEYLRRLWDEIRELTMKSTAPTLIYEEGDVIKRALRDIYNRDIEEIIIDGEEAHKAAKALMRTMIPSHAKRVQKYDDTSIPLFHRYQIEQQLDSIHDPVVNLKSGGYIVINPTEALVAIDVNSGRSTRERNVEQTAYRTNLEAAEEVARQLRLRDLAGLIVIDFIDMDESRNNHAVERRLKEAMKADRARIQIGRISHFGLLELSRQRLRPSLIEAHTQTCPTCGGVGLIRSRESTAMSILRELEEEGLRKRTRQITVKVPTEVALYLLNQKRSSLRDLEERAGFRVFVNADETLSLAGYEIERERIESEPEEAERSTESEPVAQEDGAAEAREEREGEEPRRRRRRRRRGKDTGRDQQSREAEDGIESDDEEEDEELEAADAGEERSAEGRDEQDRDGQAGGRRRRGRRGGRRRRRSGDGERPAADAADAAEHDRMETADDAIDAGEAVTDTADDGRPAQEDAHAPATAAAEAAAAREEAEAAARAADETAAAEAEADVGSAEAEAQAEVAGGANGEDHAEAWDEAAEPKAGKTAAEESTAEEADSEEAASEEAGAEDAAGGKEPALADDEPSPPEPADSRPRRSGWWRRATG